jgi:hypothetical protein
MVTICGHDRETLQWAMESWIAIDKGNIAVYAYGTKRCRPSRSRAFDDLNDPAKLAAIIAELLRGCGVNAASYPSKFNWDASGYSTDWGIYWDTMIVRDGRMMIVHCMLIRMRELTMPQSRTFAIALLDAPTLTAQDIERMIGEL